MTVLITGGTGFVGTSIAEILLERENDVVLFAKEPPLDNITTVLERKEGTYYFEQGDVLDASLIDLVIKKYKVTRIIHGAAITPDASREMENTKNIVEVNCIGTINLLDIAKENNISKVIYLSSITVFGKTAFEDQLLIEDKSIPQPNTLYGITKYTMEGIIRRYNTLNKSNIIIARIGHVYGPWEYHTSDRDLLSPIYQTTKLAKQGKKAILPRSGNISWVYSKDVALSLEALLDAEELKYDVYHIGSGETWTVVQWCELLKGKFLNFKYEVNSNNSNIVFHSLYDHAPLDVFRLKNDANYTPKYNINNSFSDYFAPK